MFTSGIIGVIITLIVIGLVLYLIDLIPMDGAIKQIIRLIIILCVIVWLLKVFGLMGWLTGLMHTPPAHPAR